MRLDFGTGQVKPSNTVAFKAVGHTNVKPPKKSTERFRQVLDSIVFVGRRDWTRTNDPHHVKVVL